MPAKPREWLVIRPPDAPEDRLDLDGAAIRVGRGRGNQVVLADEHVSGQHLEIIRRDGHRWARDLGSTNGSTLNGRPLPPNSPVPLRDGDALQLGSYSLVYRTDRANGATPHPDRDLPDVDPSGGPALLPDPAECRGPLGALVRLSLLLLLAVASLVGGAWLLAPPRVSLLVLGSDARPDEIRRGERGRTDTMMALVADRPPAGAAVVSLPRDLWVEIPGFGEERINAAYRAGGPEAAKRTVGDLLGVRLDRYLIIGLQGVREVVDAAGGVEIDVEAPIRDEAYPTDDYRTVVVEIPAGRQRMDGETALRYARTRHQDSDFARIARQQRLVAALRTALLQPANWWRAPAVLAAIRRTTETDLTPLDLAALGLSLLGSPSDPERLAVGPGLVEPFSGADGAYLLRPTPALRRTTAVFLSPAQARVEVLNASATPGLARQAAETLRGRGVQVVRSGDAPRPQPAPSVEVRSGARRAGANVAAILGLPADSVREGAVLADDLDVRVTLSGDRAAP